jgi:hypothetical protein
MARDAQLAGDRVQTEYFLQYADHYFRILSENRSRFEEQRPRREHELDEDEGDEEFVAAGEEASADERPQRPERGERFNRERRPRREERDDRGPLQDSEGDGSGPHGGETIPFDVLPPAIGRDSPEAVEAEDEAPRRPRRRTRAARPAEGEDEIAPAA